MTHLCIEKLAAGAACSEARYCASNLCSAAGACVALAVAGEPCDEDRFCESNLCGPISHTCRVAEAAMEAECEEDGECASHDCSNDGSTAHAGRCNQAIGEECDRDHCNRCWGGDGSFSNGYCGR